MFSSADNVNQVRYHLQDNYRFVFDVSFLGVFKTPLEKKNFHDALEKGNLNLEILKSTYLCDEHDAIKANLEKLNIEVSIYIPPPIQTKGGNDSAPDFSKEESAFFKRLGWNTLSHLCEVKKEDKADKALLFFSRKGVPYGMPDEEQQIISQQLRLIYRRCLGEIREILGACDKVGDSFLQEAGMDAPGAGEKINLFNCLEPFHRASIRPTPKRKTTIKQTLWMYHELMAKKVDSCNGAPSQFDVSLPLKQPVKP